MIETEAVLQGASDLMQLRPRAGAETCVIVFSHLEYLAGKFAMSSLLRDFPTSLILANFRHNSWYQEGLGPQVPSIGGAWLQAGDLAGAEAAATRALTIATTDHHCLRLHAEIVEARNDWPQATRRRSVFQRQIDGLPEGYLRGAAAAVRAGWPDNAAALLAKVEFLFSNDARACAERSRLAGLLTSCN